MTSVKNNNSNASLIAIIIWITIMVGSCLSFHKNFFLPNIPGYFFLATNAIFFSIFFGFKSKKITFKKGFVFYFFLWSLFSFFWAYNYSIAINGIIHSLIFCLIVYATTNAFLRYKNLNYHATDCILIAIIIIDVCYYIRCSMQVNSIYGFCYPFGNPNLGSAFLALGIIISTINIIIFTKKKCYHLVMLNIIPCLLLFSHLCLLKSKATFLCLFFAFFIIWGTRSRKKIFFSIATISIITIFTSFYWAALLNRIWPSVQIRLFLWTDTIKMICNNFYSVLFGWGSGNFFSVYPKFKSQESFAGIYSSDFIDYPHCYLLEITSELGIIGASFFILIFAFSIWELFKRCCNKDATRNDYIFLIALVFFFTHAQMSIAFSFMHIQFLSASIIGWCIATSKNKRFYVIPFKIILICSIGLIIMWKFYIFDSLMFHYSYKNAVIEQNKEERMNKMIAIDLPHYESYYTIQWRHHLGAILVDNYENFPLLVEENISSFDEVHKIIPGYGYYWLRKAIFYAKHNNIELADKNFALFSQKNPFSLDLWNYWGIACQYNQASTQIMAKNIDAFLLKYPKDGRILLGKGILQYLRKKNDAKKYFNESMKWAKKTGNVNKIKKLLKRYMLD